MLRRQRANTRSALKPLRARTAMTQVIKEVEVVREVQVVKEVPVEVIREVKVEVEKIVEVSKVVEKVVRVEVPGPVQVVYRDGKEIVEKERVIVKVEKVLVEAAGARKAASGEDAGAAASGAPAFLALLCAGIMGGNMVGQVLDREAQREVGLGMVVDALKEERVVLEDQAERAGEARERCSPTHRLWGGRGGRRGGP